jgi:hypothetical protein
MSDTPTQIITVIERVQQLGFVGVLIAIIITACIPLWVPVFAYRKMENERDKAVEALDKFVGIHEAQTDAMEKLVHEVAEQRKTIERLERQLERRSRS